MLNFAEQTGSGAVIVVWSFLLTATSTEKTTFPNNKPNQTKPNIANHTPATYYDVLQ
jgi:hypothetical protein